MAKKPKDPDVRGTTPAKSIPMQGDDPERRSVKRTMKSVQGPY